MPFFESPFVGLFGILHLVLFACALFSILASPMSIVSKIFWIFIVLALPAIGLLLYFLFGRKTV